MATSDMSKLTAALRRLSEAIRAGEKGSARELSLATMEARTAIRERFPAYTNLTARAIYLPSSPVEVLQIGVEMTRRFEAGQLVEPGAGRPAPTTSELSLADLRGR